jgi:ATP-dependent RNA helicase DeaD
MSLKDFLRDSLELGQDDIFKVDVKDSFSFFNSETKNLAKILEFFKDYEINGRFVNVEITDNKERGKQKRSRKRRGEKRKNESISKRRNSNNTKSQKKDFKGSRPRRNRRK